MLIVSMSGDYFFNTFLYSFYFLSFFFFFLTLLNVLIHDGLSIPTVVNSPVLHNGIGYWGD